MALGNFQGGLGFGLAFVLTDNFSGSAKQINNSMNQLESNTNKASKNIGSSFGKLGSVLGAVGIGIGLASSINKAAQLSDQMIDVGKATGLTGKELESFQSTLKGMDTQTGLTDLLGFAELGGQLGVAKQDLNDFVKVADNVSLVLAKDFGGSAETAINRIGQLKKQFRDTKDLNMSDAFNRIGSALTIMSDNGAKNIDKVALFASELGKMGNVDISQAIGMGTVFDKLGLKTKGMASQFQEVAYRMGQSDDSMAKFAKQVGMGSVQFKKMLDQNPNEAMLKLAESLQGLSKSEHDQTLKKLGISSKEASNFVRILSTNTAEFRKTQELASKSMSEGLALSKEAELRQKTLAASIGKLKRNFEILSIEIGVAIGDALQPFIEMVNKGVVAIGKFLDSPMGKEFMNIATSIGVGVAALKAFQVAMIVAKKLSMSFINSLAKGFAAFAANPFTILLAPLALLIGAFFKAQKAFAEFDGTVKSGFGGFLQKFGGIIAAVKEIWSSWDSVNNQFSMSSGLVEKLTKLGIMDLALAIGTWVVRIKEFLKGIIEGFKKAFGFVKKLVMPIFEAIGSVLKAIGIQFGKNTTATEKWGQVGQYVGMAILGILAAITVALAAIAVSMLISFAPVILVVGAIGLAIYAVIKVVGWLIDKLSSMWDWVKGLVDVGAQMVQNIWDGFKSMWGSFVSWLLDQIEKVPLLGWAVKFMREDGSTMDAVERAKQQVAADNPELAAKTDNSVMQNSTENMGVIESMRQRAMQIQNNLKIQPATTTVNLDGDKVGEFVTKYQEEQNSRE